MIWWCSECGHLWQNSVAADQWLGLTHWGHLAMSGVVDQIEWPAQERA